MAEPTHTSKQSVIHFGPVWYKRGLGERFSFAACEIEGPHLLTTHVPWVTCDSCKQAKSFTKEAQEAHEPPFPPTPTTCRHCGKPLDSRLKCRIPDHNF